jgi:hypothetical protein
MGTVWFDQFLPFGCCTLLAILDLGSSAFHWILQTQRGWQHTLDSLDDFLAIFPHSAESESLNRNNGAFSQICSNLGLQIKEEKHEEGHCIRFLAIETNTDATEVFLLPKKH